MKVNFPLPLSVHHVAEELLIIQQAIFVSVIRLDDTLQETKTALSIAGLKIIIIIIIPMHIDAIKNICYLDLPIR